MPCRIEISKQYRDKYDLPENMPEAEFYAWLANGGLESVAADANIKFSFVKIDDTKFKESVGIRERVKEKIELTIRALNTMIYGAESAGIKAGQKISEERINMLQKAAKDFLKEVGVKETVRISTAIGKIRNQNHLVKFFNLIDEKIDLDARLYEVEQIDKKLDVIQKMRKSVKRLNVNNIKFIKELNLPSSYEISDLKKYGELLDEYIDKRKGGKATTNVEKELNDFIAGEKAYIDAYKEQIENIKELIKYAQWAKEYRDLKEKGLFEGTGIKSEEDWLSLKESLEAQDKESEITANEEKLEKIEEKAAAKKAAVASVIKNINDFIKENKPELEGYFKEYSTTENQFLLSDIEAIDLSKLSFNKLILLNNILQNILYSNDFVGVGQFTSEGRLSKKKESLFQAVKERVRGFLRGIPNDEDVDRRTIIQTITKVADGGKALYAALDFILGSWNGKIGSIRKNFDETFSIYEKLKNAMAKNSEDLFKSTVRVDTYAFINQWFKADSVENQIAHVKLRVARIASQYASQYKTNVEDTTPTQSRKLELDRSIEGLKALEAFGVISNLNISDKEATYDLVEDINLETLNDKLNPKEKAVYDFVVNSYKSLLPDFTQGVNANLGKNFDEVENYYPSFTYRDYDAGNIAISSEANVTPLDLAKEFTPFSKTKSNTKDRGKTLAPDGFKYKMGLSENFSKGLWITLMTAKASNEMSDMSNILNSSKGLVRLRELGLDAASLSIIKQKLKEKVDADMVYGSVNPSLETAVSDELKKLRNNLIVGFLLKDFTQLFKQGAAPLFTSAISNPELTLKALFSTNTKEAQDAINFLIQNTSVPNRLTVYEQSSTIRDTPIENLRGKQAEGTRAIRGYINIQEKYISDIITPLYKIFNKKAAYNSMLEAVDAYVSVTNIIVGYVKNRQKQNPKLTFEDVIAELNNGVIDGQSVQAAEKYQEDMNAPSNQSDAAKVLKEDKNKLIYFMKSFILATSMSFNAAKGDLLTKNDLESDVIKEKRGIVFRFIAQQTLYRAINHFALSYFAGVVAKSLFGAGDEDDEYELQKKFLSLGAGLGSDLFLGKYNIFYEMAYTLAVNAGFRFYASKELEKRKEVDPNFDSKALKTNLVMESKMGGAQTFSIELFKTGERTYNLLSKREEETPATDPVVETATRTFLPLLSGSGTVRYFTNKANAAAKEEEMRINLIYSDIAGKFGFQYGLSEGDLQSVLSDLKDAKFSEIRGRLLFKPVREDYGILYVLTKEDMEKAKKEANIALYGKGNPTREDILKSSVIGKLNLNPNASEETKLALAGKKYKEVYNKLLDSYILKAKAYQVTAKK
jgi:hypothetical protein